MCRLRWKIWQPQIRQKEGVQKKTQACAWCVRTAGRSFGAASVRQPTRTDFGQRENAGPHEVRLFAGHAVPRASILVTSLHTRVGLAMVVLVPARSNGAHEKTTTGGLYAPSSAWNVMKSCPVDRRARLTRRFDLRWCCRMLGCVTRGQ